MLHFMGIGAQKCGTTWIYENLKNHPELYFPGKEIHFWDMYYDRGVQWYLSLFPDEPHKLNGEITPAYAILEEEKVRMIYGLSPELRLFYVMRDPRERAWSAALMEMGYANKTFAETSDEWFIDQFYSKASLRRGDYKTCLQHWVEIFPSDQLLLLNFADIKRSPHSFLEKLSAHIGVSDPGFFSEARGNTIADKVFANDAHALRPSLKTALHKLYYAQIQEFNQFMGRVWFNPDAPEWAEAA